jgi:hypothetical protein
MDTVPTPAPEQTYPIPAPASDPRFSFVLTIDVARVLAEHGYPPITAGGDPVTLQQALFGFLYASTVHDPDPRGLGYYRGPDDPAPAELPTGVDGHPHGGHR